MQRQRMYKGRRQQRSPPGNGQIVMNGGPVLRNNNPIIHSGSQVVSKQPPVNQRQNYHFQDNGLLQQPNNIEPQRSQMPNVPEAPQQQRQIPHQPAPESEQQPTIIMERPSNQKQQPVAIPAEAQKRVKRVRLVEEGEDSGRGVEVEEDQSSVIPQLSVQGKEEQMLRKGQMQDILQQTNVQGTEKVVKITDKIGTRAPSNGPQTAQGPNSGSLSRSPQDRSQPGANKRNNPDFARHKSSKAMSQLLKADEALINKQKRMITAQKTRQPSQKEIVNQRVGVHQAPAAGMQAQQQDPRIQSRSVGSGSRGRPSSKWREGITQENIDKAEEDSALNALENQEKRIVYPEWWEGKDEIEREEQKRKLMMEQDPSRVFKVANPAKVKVNKNLERYAEDSLDARLRQVKDDVERPQGMPHDDMIYVQQQTPAGIKYRVSNRDQQAQIMNGNREFVPEVNPVQMSSQKKKRRNPKEQYQQHQQQVYHQQQQSINPYVPPQDAYYSQDSIEPSVYSSSARIIPGTALHSSSTKQLNMLDSTTGPDHLARTQGSQSHGSFAYTSNKVAPKYSPARDPRAGASNIPMSYAGPPSRQEIERNRDRIKSGNRNFQNTVSNQQSYRQHQSAQQQMIGHEEGSLDSRLNRVHDMPPPNGSSRRKRIQTEQLPKNGSNFEQETQQVYMQQQKEAERNRKRIEDEIRRQQEGSPIQEESIQETSLQGTRQDISRQEQDGGGGMRKFAKGGVAITISASPEQEERERSGSKPKYPFMDLDPFKGNNIPHPERENSNEAQFREQRRSARRIADAARSQSSVERLYAQRRIPQQYQSVESTLKQRIDYDRRQHQEKQRVNQMRQYQDQVEGQQSADNIQNQTQDGQEQVQAQIFYKKNDSKVIYEEGVDDSFTYPYKQQLEEQLKHQELQQQNLSTAIDSIRRKKIENDPNRYHMQNQYSQPHSSSYLRRRDVSPHTKEVINSGYYNISDNQVRPQVAQSLPQGQIPTHYPPQDQIELQMQVRQSRDYHNETGFTQKLLGQGSSQTQMHPNERSYIMSNPSNPSSSHEPGRNGTILSSDQTYGNGGAGGGQEFYRGGNRPPAPPFSNGYYDQNGVYHERGDIGQWQQQMHPQNNRMAHDIGPEDSYDATESEENKNNTSRFAFGGPTTEQRYMGERQYQESRTDPRVHDNRDPRDNGGVFHGQNNSTIPHNEDSSSLITPNVSYGGRAQLQNQLEQVLMMKSGEFSAGRKQNDTQYRSGGSIVNIHEETGVNASHYSQTMGNRPPEDYRRQGAPTLSQNYGNPNFVPPPNKQSPFVIERRGPGGRDSGRVSFRNYNEENQNQGSQFASQQPINYREQYPATYQRYNGKDPRYYQDSEEHASGGDPNRNFNTSQFPDNHDSRPSNQSNPKGSDTQLEGRGSIGQDYKRQGGHQKSNSRSLYGAQPLPDQIAYQNNEQQQPFVPQGGNNFTLQRPSRADFIGPDRRMTDPGAPKQNYYVDNTVAASAAPGNGSVRQGGSTQQSLKEGGERMSDEGAAWQSQRQQAMEHGEQPEGVESFEGRNRSRAGHLDYRISSGKSLKKRDAMIESVGQMQDDSGKTKPIKNYQTFNEDDSQQQQQMMRQDQMMQQQSYEGTEESAMPNRWRVTDESALQDRVEIYNQQTETDQADNDMPQNTDMDADQMEDHGEMMGTSEMSPQHSPISNNQNKYDDISQNVNEASMVTANLRNFMEEAQPADGLLNSQSQYGTSSQIVDRKNQGAAQLPALDEDDEESQQQYDLTKPGVTSGMSQEPSSRTDEKEGGSNENGRGHGAATGSQMSGGNQQQLMINANSFKQASQSNRQSGRNTPSQREDRIYRDMTEESSPDISQTEQTSQILSPDKAGLTGTDGTNDDGDISSSLQETPMSTSKKQSPSAYGTSSRPTTSKRDPGASSQNQILQTSSNYDLQENIRRVTEQAQRLTEQLQHWHGASHSQTKSLMESTSNAADSQMVSPSKEARKQRVGQASQDSQSDSLSPLRDSEL